MKTNVFQLFPAKIYKNFDFSTSEIKKILWLVSKMFTKWGNK